MGFCKRVLEIVNKAQNSVEFEGLLIINILVSDPAARAR
jgi:hypothetical protein